MLCQYLYSIYSDAYTQIGWLKYQGNLRETLLTQINPKCFLESFKDLNADEQYTEIKNYSKGLPKDSLIIVDNIESSDKEELRLLTALSCHVLATSREQLNNFKIHSVGVLSLEESLELFRKIYTFHIDEEASVEKIITLAGRHTLTIDLLAKTCKAGGYSTDELLSKLNEAGFTLVAIPEKIATSWHDEDDEKFFAHLVKVFELNKLTNDEEHILINLSVLPSQFIPKRRIRDLLALDNLKDLNELHRKGYLVCSADSQKIYVHKIIREVMKHNKKPSYKDCKTLLHNLTSASKGNVTDSFMNLLWIIPLVNEVLISLPENELTAILLNNLSTLYHALNDLSRALEYQLKAIAINEIALPKNHQGLATSYDNLSILHQDMDEFDKALEYQIKAINIREVALSKNHPDLATSYDNLSILHQDMDELDKALEYQLKAINIREVALSKNHPDLATSYNNFSILYQDMDEFDKALEYQLKAISIDEIALSKNHPDLATSYNNLSILYHDMDEHDKALDYQLKAIKIRKIALPKNHPDLATSYDNLSSLYHDIDELDKALEYQLKAIKIRKIVLPDNHSLLIDSYFVISSIYYELNNYDDSLHYQKLAALIQDKSYAKDDPSVIISRENISRLEKLVKGISTTETALTEDNQISLKIPITEKQEERFNVIEQATLPENYSYNINACFRKLSNACKNKHLTLICGAGVSIDANLPTWDELLHELIKNAENEDLVRKDDVASFSQIVLGGYIKDILGKKLNIKIHEALYKKSVRNSDLINKIVELCKPGLNSSPLESIITYNYDSLLEDKLAEKEIMHQPIYCKGVKADTKKIPIYHVHGYLPRNKKIPPEQSLIFHEASYHTQFLEPYTWANLILLHKLCQNTCLIIGCSLGDPNLRCLLDVNSRNNIDRIKDHYIVKKIPKTDIQIKIEERDANRLGLEMIWVDNYDCIPDIIKRIRLYEDSVPIRPNFYNQHVEYK